MPLFTPLHTVPTSLHNMTRIFFTKIWSPTFKPPPPQVYSVTAAQTSSATSLCIQGPGSYIAMILWRLDPLLSGDSVKNDRFWATARETPSR
jgi:hypothetical protein